jgi:FkbM family methyltransferase
MRIENMKKKFLLILSVCVLITLVGIVVYYGTFNRTKSKKYEYVVVGYKNPTFDTPPLPSCAFGQKSRDFMKASMKDKVAERIAKACKCLKKDEKGFELWDTPHGQFWITSNNFIYLTELLAEQEADIYGDQSIGVRPGDIVLDCGAHIGVYTRKALGLGAKLVVAIEIAPVNIELLRRNFAAEIDSGKVIVYPKGVWDKDDTLVVHYIKNTAGDSVVFKGRADGPPVPLTTIDKIVAELGLARVDFIKADIEGAERNALTGAAKTLERFKPRMAIAGYHLKDDLIVLPAIALIAQPTYKACLLESEWDFDNIIIFE